MTDDGRGFQQNGVIWESWASMKILQRILSLTLIGNDVEVWASLEQDI